MHWLKLLLPCSAKTYRATEHKRQQNLLEVSRNSADWNSFRENWERGGGRKREVVHKDANEKGVK